MKLYIVGQRREFEVVSFDPETHVAVLRNEKGEECIDPNFWPDMVQRAGYQLQQREE